MSRTEIRQEVDEWEVEICDTCGHEEGQHYDAPKKVDVAPDEYYIASGCMCLKEGGRILEGFPRPNPYRRCPCTEFK